ncbi:MAG: DUF4347 domain-containing protein [Kofleriaceae bacterium]
MTHVLVIGSRPDTEDPPDAFMDEVAAYCAASQLVTVVRCERLADFAATIAAVADGRVIDVLDIFDHGAAGTMWLGDGILFQSNADPASPLVGAAHAQAIARCLAPCAQVRLLGCDVAAQPIGAPVAAAEAGRLLLVKLARVLGRHRVVLGTIRDIGPALWTPDGLHPDAADDTFFSSLAALDGVPPSLAARVEHLGALVG